MCGFGTCFFAKSQVSYFSGDKLSLFIPKARKDMSGKYSVKVSNKHGSEESSAELNIGMIINEKIA